jgi:hypothetical protein
MSTEPARMATALNRIREMCRPQIVKTEGEDDTPPSFLEIYNLAHEGLGDSGTELKDCSLANPDTPC